MTCFVQFQVSPANLKTVSSGKLSALQGLVITPHTSTLDSPLFYLSSTSLGNTHTKTCCVYWIDIRRRSQCWLSHAGESGAGGESQASLGESMVECTVPGRGPASVLLRGQTPTPVWWHHQGASCKAPARPGSDHRPHHTQ